MWWLDAHTFPGASFLLLVLGGVSLRRLRPWLWLGRSFTRG